MIALLCPSKGRPEKLRRMWDSAKVTASNIQLCITVSKEEYPEYLAVLRAEGPTTAPSSWILQEPDLLPTVHKWNKSADLAMTQKDIKLFMVAGDDMIFDTPGWDKALLDHYNALDNKIHVFSLRDSRDPDGTPHPVVSREYIEALGYMIPPIFTHWEIDVWTVAIAKANNCFTHLKDYLLIHDKDSDKGKPDQTHIGIRSYGWRERDAYVARTCRHFLEIEKNRLKQAIWRSNLQKGWKANEYEDAS